MSTLIDGEWKVVLDFTLDVGDALPYHQHVVVNSVDTIMVGEELYRRLWLGTYDDEGKCYWIALKRCYDLQGRKVTGTATRGIYVKDGKKVVIK